MGEKFSLLPTAFRFAQNGAPPSERASAGPSEDELAKLAQKANNPLSDVWLLLTQNDTTIINGTPGEHSEAQNSFKFQPVMPIPLLDNRWNLIFRPVFPYFRYATPVRGLYLCSSYAHPGAGVHGMCGYNAARVALRRE